MSIPAKHEYLEELCTRLAQRWPDNRTVNIVCHGHSVPAGYAATPCPALLETASVGTMSCPWSSLSTSSLSTSEGTLKQLPAQHV